MLVISKNPFHIKYIFVFSVELCRTVDLLLVRHIGVCDKFVARKAHPKLADQKEDPLKI
jgi:hypothetical protein